jgi:hypothetical protein
MGIALRAGTAFMQPVTIGIKAGLDVPVIDNFAVFTCELDGFCPCFSFLFK